MKKLILIYISILTVAVHGTELSEQVRTGGMFAAGGGVVTALALKVYQSSSLKRRLNRAKKRNDRKSIERLQKQSEKIDKQIRIALIIALAGGGALVASHFLKTLPINDNASKYGNKAANILFMQEQRELLAPEDKAYRVAFPKTAVITSAEAKQITPTSLEEILKRQGFSLTGGTSLMVRSTGSEDTDEYSNAGGNESIANVHPSANEICSAIQKVVASYSSEKSVRQRSGQGDSTFTPILIQEMIGEKKDGHIPVSGVMFTKDPLCGITLIQAAFGHNEYVVKGGSPVDTFYVGGEKAIYPVIRKKPTRLTPDSTSGKLKSVENSEAMANRPCLSSTQVKIIHDAGEKIEKLYKKPMDIEFTFIGETLYILQARPLIANSTKNPSYIKNIPSSAPRGHMVITSDAGVVDCFSTQVICKKTIDQALSQYMLNPNKYKIACINQEASQTSHPAVMFRSKEIPVIVLKKEYASIEKLLTDERGRDNDYASRLQLDQQQAAIIVTPRSDKFYNPPKTPPGYPIELGWISLPLQQQASILAEFYEQQFPDGVALKNAYQKSEEKSLSQDIETLKIGSEELAKQALARITLTLATLTPHNKDLQNAIWSMAYRIAPMLIIAPGDKHFVKRLFSIHWLESIIYQQQKNNAVISSLSVAKEWKKAEPGKEEKSVIQMLSPYAVNPEVKAKIESLREKDGDEMTTMIGIIAKAGVLPVWINTSVAQANNYDELIDEFNRCKPFLVEAQKMQTDILTFSPQAFSEKNTFQKSLADLTNTNTKMIELFKDNSSQNIAKLVLVSLIGSWIETFDTSIKALTGSSTIETKDKISFFTEMLNEYLRLLTEVYTFAEAAGISMQEYRHGESDEVSRIPTSEVLKKQGLFERIFNAIKGLPQDDTLLKQSQYFLVEQMTPGSGSNITYNTNRRCLTCEKSAASLKSYIDAPDATINLFGEQKSYDGFVQVLTKDQNSWPSTLEDFFILTHQSLIAIQQSLFQHYGISKQILEEKDKEIIQEIETILSNIHHLNTNDSHSMVNEIVSIGNTEKLMLLSPEENKIVATFTIPLRSHSGKLSITIPRNVQDLLKLNLRIYGGAENGRWAALEGLTENYIKAHPTIKGFGASSEASFQLQSTFSQDDKNNVLSLVQGVCEISLSDAPISSSNQDLTQHLKQKNTYMEGRCRHVSSGHTRKTLRCRTHRDNCPALSK